MIPECRKYPWMFIGEENPRPFAVIGVTYEDVRILLDLGYGLTEDDLHDISVGMDLEEILKLWKYHKIKLYGEFLRLNRTYNLKYESLLHEEQCNLSSELIGSCAWSIYNISMYVDVSIILDNPRIPWDRSRMSRNRTVTLEHMDRIDSGNAIGSWIYYKMMDRSPIDLCLKYLRESDIYGRDIKGLASNPSITADDVITIIHSIDIPDPSEMWHGLSRYMNIEEIITLDGMMQCSWTEAIWSNRTITPGNIMEVRRIMNNPDRDLYYNCDLSLVSIGQGISTNDRIILTEHPRILEHDRFDYSGDDCMDRIIMNSDLDLIEEHIEDLHFIDMLLMRSDLTPRILQVIKDNLVCVSYGSRYSREPKRPCQLHPQQLIDMFPGEVTSRHLSHCRWLDVTRLYEYDCECYPRREYICSVDEVDDTMEFSLLVQNPKLTHSKIQDLLSRGLISQQDIEDNWSYIQSYMNIPDLPKFNLPLCERTISHRLNNGRHVEHPVESALFLDMSDAITTNTRGLTIELADRLDIEVDYNNLTIEQLCIRGLDQVDLQDMCHIPMRFRLLGSLGHLDCIRNSFRPMIFSEKSMTSFIDIEVVVSDE